MDLFQPLLVTDQGFCFLPVPEMEPVALAIPVIFTICTLSPACPAAVPEGLETGGPYPVEVILIDISLYKGAVDVGTG